ncbi:unnamed protein product [Gordionus sp. m RMFG-2023]|uniref:uncharacterized protein LOC135929334 n=1 Tax=Gordionus sp. m RMFG-2023 TaxID=3053472 RepID=UPI0030E518E7
MDMGKTCLSYFPRMTISPSPDLKEDLLNKRIPIKGVIHDKNNSLTPKSRTENKDIKVLPNLPSYLHQKVFSYQYDMVSVFSIQGKRATMEDKFRVVQQKSPFPILIFGVFDGHGGSFAVEYVESKLIPNILNAMNHYIKKMHPKHDITTSNKDNNNNQKSQQIFLNSTERSVMYNRILSQEILTLDKALLQKADYMNNNSGTTCLLGILFAGDLVLANTGDCRAIMYDSKGRTLQLTVDHKPQNTCERERIRRAGGFVTLSQAGIWRLNGILSVSRGFGDLSLKRYNNVITAKPDIHIYPMLKSFGSSDTLKLKDHDSSSSYTKYNSDEVRLQPDFLVLASDGLWNSMGNVEVTHFLISSSPHSSRQNPNESSSIHKSVLNHSIGAIPPCEEPDFGARALALKALKLGSTDNVTVLIVKFKPPLSNVVNPNNIDAKARSNKFTMKPYDYLKTTLQRDTDKHGEVDKNHAYLNNFSETSPSQLENGAEGGRVSIKIRDIGDFERSPPFIYHHPRRSNSNHSFSENTNNASNINLLDKTIIDQPSLPESNMVNKSYLDTKRRPLLISGRSFTPPLIYNPNRTIVGGRSVVDNSDINRLKYTKQGSVVIPVHYTSTRPVNITTTGANNILDRDRLDRSLNKPSYGENPNSKHNIPNEMKRDFRDASAGVKTCTSHINYQNSSLI